MNCTAFDRWLDAGSPAATAAAARVHARDCERCAAALDASLELDVALGVVPAAPAGFTDRVMARVAETPQAAAVIVAPLRVAPAPEPFAWWVRAAMEPSMLLATTLAAMLMLWSGPIARGGLVVAAALNRALASGAATHPDVRVAWVISLAMLPTACWLGWRLFLWSAKRA